MRVLKAALLGRSLPYSISSEVHNAVFNIIQAKCTSNFDSIDYSKIECENEDILRTHIVKGKQDGFVGFNITFPYKYVASIMEGNSSSVVRRIHSANTIDCTKPLKIISTDGNGFLFALEKSFSHLSYSEFALVILGAGGGARAVLDSLNNFAWRQKIIAARSIEAALRAAEPYSSVEPLLLDDFKRDAGRQFIVNATPVGQRTRDALLRDFKWESRDIALDLVYNPLRTRFLDQAVQAGARTVDGLGMLIEQAALSQYFWMTGGESTESVLRFEEFRSLHASLSTLLTPRWDAFAI